MPSYIRIRHRRNHLGLTQAQLAERLKRWLPSIDHSDISRIETGRRAVRADELPAFAKALRCRMEDLVDPLE